MWLYRPPRPRPSWTLSRFRLGYCHVACLSRPKVVNTWSACCLLMAVGLCFILTVATTASTTASPRSLPHNRHRWKGGRIMTVGNGIIWNSLFFSLQPVGCILLYVCTALSVLKPAKQVCWWFFSPKWPDLYLFCWFRSISTFQHALSSTINLYYSDTYKANFLKNRA